MHRRALIRALAAAAAAAPLAARAAEKSPADAAYVPLQTLTAYTNRPGGRRGVMTVDCGIEVPDAALRQRVNEILPRLRAAYVEALQIYAGGLPSGYPPNPDYLARNLQRQTDQLLGKRGAQILLGAIVVI